jgi:hypothetical protein
MRYGARRGIVNAHADADDGLGAGTSEESIVDGDCDGDAD